jgi:hypothetical protein
LAGEDSPLLTNPHNQGLLFDDAQPGGVRAKALEAATAPRALDIKTNEVCCGASSPLVPWSVQCVTPDEPAISLRLGRVDIRNLTVLCDAAGSSATPKKLVVAIEEMTETTTTTAPAGQTRAPSSPNTPLIDIVGAGVASICFPPWVCADDTFPKPPSVDELEKERVVPVVPGPTINPNDWWSRQFTTPFTGNTIPTLAATSTIPSLDTIAPTFTLTYNDLTIVSSS